MNTPRRTIRIEDELWTAAAAKAEKEGTTVTEVIRTALQTYVKAGAALVLAVLAILTLSACGSDEPATQPVAERTAVLPTSVAETPAMTDTEAQAVIDASIWAEMAAGDAEANATMLRVVKGECFSVSFASTAEEWSEHMADRPALADGSVWLKDMREWVTTLPTGCDETDRASLGFYQ